MASLPALSTQTEGGVTVGYLGVHAAYQAALTAAELGRLDCFYCSLLAAPGKWGGLISRVAGADRLASRRLSGLPLERVVEHPWPFLAERLHAWVGRGGADRWLRACEAFDRWLANQLAASRSRLIYGVDSCAEATFRQASAMGMVRVAECPGVHPKFMQGILAETFGGSGQAYLAAPIPQRKLRTYELADVLVTHSAIHTRSFVTAGIPRDRIFECPLWVDPGLFHAEGRVPRPASGGRLRAVFAGRVNVLKGIPWLCDALRRLQADVELTVVGSADAKGRELLGRAPTNVTHRPPVTKAELRAIYQRHDVLVLPSLMDTFGSVALEAMACGLPVIVTDHCGVPVPDESWRVPVRDSDAIAGRLAMYAGDRARLARDAQAALAFARQQTPAAFRQRLAAGFQAWGVEPRA